MEAKNVTWWPTNVPGTLAQILVSADQNPVCLATLVVVLKTIRDALTN